MRSQSSAWATQKVIDILRQSGITATARSIDPGQLAVDVAQALVSETLGAKVREAVARDGGR